MTLVTSEGRRSATYSWGRIQECMVPQAVEGAAGEGQRMIFAKIQTLAATERESRRMGRRRPRRLSSLCIVYLDLLQGFLHRRTGQAERSSVPARNNVAPGPGADVTASTLIRAGPRAADISDTRYRTVPAIHGKRRAARARSRNQVTPAICLAACVTAGSPQATQAAPGKPPRELLAVSRILDRRMHVPRRRSLLLPAICSSHSHCVALRSGRGHRQAATASYLASRVCPLGSMSVVTYAPGLTGRSHLQRPL